MVKPFIQIKPKTGIDKAIAYSLGKWEKLERYLENGANASEILYSLVETAKANGLTPFVYLQRLLEALQKNPANIGSLLLWHVDQPQQINN